MPAHKTSPVWRLWKPGHHLLQRTGQVQVLPFQTICLKYRQVLGFGGKLSCGLLTPVVVHVKYRKRGLLLAMGYLVATCGCFIPTVVHLCGTASLEERKALCHYGQACRDMEQLLLQTEVHFMLYLPLVVFFHLLFG